MTLGWDNDENNNPIKVLKNQFRTIAKAPEHSEDNVLHLKLSITIPLHHTVVAEVMCRDCLVGQHIIVPDSSLMFENPNLKFESMCYENPEETEAKILPVILKNFDSQQYIHLLAQTVIAFAKAEEESEIVYAEVAEIKSLTESIKEQCRNWLPKENPSQTS